MVSSLLIVLAGSNTGIAENEWKSDDLISIESKRSPRLVVGRGIRHNGHDQAQGRRRNPESNCLSAVRQKLQDR
jgi:hypothetical protein